jgi:cholesterol oxidase
VSDHFDAIVVGSGFGGSVTAARLAEAGRRVLVLERGRPYPPGSFPRTPREFSTALWDPSEGLHGMYDLWSFEGLEALVASGLGGGSLIYANVMLRKDPAWFDAAEGWPVSYDDLVPHYEEAERRMGATTYPYAHTTPKTVAFRDAARRLGQDWFLPGLAVTFAPEPGAEPVPGEPIREARPNLHGRTRRTCELVGECDVGCNAGAKNTLDFTYLTDAMHAGAEIRTRCEVRGFEPGQRGWHVHYVEHDDEVRDTAALPRTTVTADRLVLAAGTLGTTYLLLRNRAALPGLSGALGTRFSGNGDLLTFATRTGNPVDPSYGPVITSAVRVPDALDGGGAEGRGFYLEDAGIPAFAEWLLQAADLPRTVADVAPDVIARLARRAFGREDDTNLSAELARAIGECGLSAGVLPLLGMGRDMPDGRMTLEDGQLQVDWRKQGGSETYFDRVRALSERMAGELGGGFMDNLIWHLNRVITVHPLGGAPMSDDPSGGVVDANGEVHGHPGLHVADGSVVPGPVGANPSLTIAALADRFSTAILEGRTQPLRRAAPAAQAAAPTMSIGRDGAVGIAFTEQMKGEVRFRGSDDDEPLMFELTIATDDLEAFEADPRHGAVATGVVRCDALGGERPVERGWFELFVGERDKRMHYWLHVRDAEDHPVTLAGHKVVRDDPGVDNVWRDTSTLYVQLLHGHVELHGEGEAFADGVLRIKPLDFAKQLTTFDTTPDRRPDAVARFGALFAGQLWEVYGPGAGR